LGIGIIISAILMNMAYATKLNISIEREARKLGMIYPIETKVLEEEPETKVIEEKQEEMTP
jgi:hypothetical protein